MKKITAKQCIAIVFFTLSMLFLLSPFYLDISGIWKQASNRELQINITTNGKNAPDIQMLSETQNIVPDWCNSHSKSCVVINSKMKSKWRAYKVEFQLAADGDITLSLQGPTKRNNEKIDYPILVNYKDLIINKQVISNKKIKASVSEPYQYTFSAQKGEVIEFNFMATRNFFDFLNFFKNSNFNGLMFLSILILSFFSSFKLVQYITKFKILENNSRIDIVFVVVFIALLFIPISHISTLEKSERENRMLASKPALFINNQFNQKYTKQFEVWFNDRFATREYLIKVYNLLTTFLKGESNQVSVGKEDWLFYKGDNSINNFANITELTDAELEQGTKYLQAIDDFCKKHHKQFYYIIAPDKSKIYGEYYNSAIKKKRPDSYGIAHQFIQYLRKNSTVKVVYFYDTFMKQKEKDLLYFKGDTHWNELGAYWGYKDFEKYLKNDMDVADIDTKIKSWSYKTSDMYDLSEMLGIKDGLYKSIKYKMPDFISNPTCEFMEKDNLTSNLKCANPKGKYAVFVLRDSFAGAFNLYLSQVFKKSSLNWRYNLTKKDLSEIIENYDVVILENVERFIPKILTQTFPED